MKIISMTITTDHGGNEDERGLLTIKYINNKGEEKKMEIEDISLSNVYSICNLLEEVANINTPPINHYY